MFGTLVAFAYSFGAHQLRINPFKVILHVRKEIMNLPPLIILCDGGGGCGGDESGRDSVFVEKGIKTPSKSSLVVCPSLEMSSLS